MLEGEMERIGLMTKRILGWKRLKIIRNPYSHISYSVILAI